VSAAFPTGQPEHRGPDGDAGGWGYFVAVVVVSTVGTGVPVVSILGVSFAALLQAFRKYFPECVDPLVRVERPQRIGPPLLDKASIAVAHLRPEQGIIDPAFRRRRRDRSA